MGKLDAVDEPWPNTSPPTYRQTCETLAQRQKFSTRCGHVYVAISNRYTELAYSTSSPHTAKRCTQWRSYLELVARQKGTVASWQVLPSNSATFLLKVPSYSCSRKLKGMLPFFYNDLSKWLLARLPLRCITIFGTPAYKVTSYNTSLVLRYEI
jgi:hypothetical protein